MLKKKFKDKEISMLGFGAMRLPLTGGENGAPIDEAAVNQMVKYAHENGVNYFDTAYPYHGGESERVLGRALKQLPRGEYYLATKYPGHQISKSYNPKAVFEEQLEKCDVEYFDFYLLHNVYEKSIHTYMDPQWGIVEYFLEQKKLGRIRHLGFSFHGGLACLENFLQAYGDVMEFCQIQLNYLDWTLQDAKGKYDLLTAKNIPVWVMEPVRGGKLATLPQGDEEQLRALRGGESTAAWAFRWLQGLPNVVTVLSGMSNMQQLVDNVKTFSGGKSLNEEETALLFEIAEKMKNSLPCTACRYCCESCPQGLDIPELIDMYNQLRFDPAINIGMRVEALDEGKRPAACIVCGKCVQMCPQNIDIPKAMGDFSEAVAKLPSWAEICKQRDEAAKKD